MKGEPVMSRLLVRMVWLMAVCVPVLGADSAASITVEPPAVVPDHELLAKINPRPHGVATRRPVARGWGGWGGRGRRSALEGASGSCRVKTCERTVRGDPG